MIVEKKIEEVMIATNVPLQNDTLDAKDGKSKRITNGRSADGYRT